MRVGSVPFVVAIAALVLAGSCASPDDVFASDRASAPRAEALFERGKVLFDAGRTEEACDAFAESDRIDPAVGTLGLLAACHEKQGRIATARTEYLEVARRARAKSDSRATFAEERAAALEAVVPLLFLRLAAREPGLEVLRDGRRLEDPEIGAPLAVDPGFAELTARAPGKLTWRRRVHLPPGSRVTVDLPALSPDRAASSADAWTTGAFVAAGVGLVGVGIGTGFAANAVSKKSDSDSHCDENSRCDARGGRMLDDAKTSAAVSTVAFGVGLTGAATAIVLAVSAPSSRPKRTTFRFAPHIDAAGAGGSLSGAF